MLQPTTTQQISQDPSQMSPEDAKASLGMANMLMQQIMPQQPQQPPEASQTQESAPGQEQPQEATKETPKESAKQEKDPMKEMELMFTTKLDEIRQELKKDNQREIDTLKETITQALSENEPN